MILAAAFPLSGGILVHSPKLTWVGIGILAIPLLCASIWLFYVLWSWITAPAPRMAKAHSKLMADEYLRLGWTLIHQFCEPSGSEPYEYLFEWRREGSPVHIDPKKFRDVRSSD